ncbi:monosaccharide ABC transporter ATP-binding protein (CUT2 family)|uniref:Monosaccharide ABC transporter ATP-binding protein (CUT2 family) n=1 Tax=Brenneria salicis ATCC 15712 = DSM 30166 TaxID=714314 RepID=A0A366HWR7_9GAMM|nr:sugar ABC transporter ATP-binding protein [Brenneria salicis]NMN91319.1 monosaccharide ABC transporter ATP-binding protein (CUT2 family) [Brenneria salicis ATCC 15712 = DSM 30166]RBP57848.1 monosaccharide ABC transporter ATP-binding protein (CUT2 family) [Brenneria salicis ATCC 15712 = DSM 30166]RLM28889.1 ABC transporter [Brenneria salicis ATCC 15712 = DSM 30166]
MTATTQQTRLEMRDISISFSGFNALKQVNFTLEGGSIHALTGANGAGKSTLMTILSGAYRHYRGDIIIDGARVDIHSPRAAKRYGIHLVQQEVDVALIPTLSVAENIMLDTLAQTGHMLNWPRLYQQAQALLDQIGVHLNVRQRLDRCSLAEKQQVLLARALSHECRFLILDEPTAPLDQAESARLFQVVRRLQADGIGIVFISHRIHELSEICDTLTVLRDGEFVSSGPMQGLSGEQIVERMLGHQLDDIFPPRRSIPQQDILLQVAGLHDETLLRDISLTLRKGEILGIAGLAGAGKTELCKALFGANPSQIASGEYRGTAWKPRSPYQSNLSVSASDSFSRWGVFSHQQALGWARHLIRQLTIRTTGPMQKLARLSGGNQQKVAIGKWLRSEAQVLIFDEPTKGVDIKAKQDLFSLIDGLAQQGKGIIYASGEFSELVGLCDRICVLWDGRIVAELNASDIDEETLLLYSTGGTPA